MRTETIYNPDLFEDTNYWQSIRPVFSHFEVEHQPALRESDSPIIGRLLKADFDVHKTVSTFYMGFPTHGRELQNHFASNVREEFQIDLEPGTFLRFRFVSPRGIYLTLFYVDYARQGQGRGTYWFPRVVDGLFRAGAAYLWGKVAPAYCRQRFSMDAPRLTRFYERNGFVDLGDGRIWADSPYDEDLDGLPTESPKSQATETRKASEMATIS